MKRTSLQVMKCVVSCLFLAVLAAGSDSVPTPSGWKLVWSDEFNEGTQPDPAKWAYDVGGQGWGNRELQHYTEARPENARLESGRLIIEARREPWQGNDYTSARLITKGKADWTYGRFEIRAKVPRGRGTWAAIWMLPTVWDLGNGLWPDNGEIDIMEHVGHDTGVIHATTHSRKYHYKWQSKDQRTASTPVPAAAEAFHDYVLEWDEGEIRVYVDGRHYFTSRQDGGDWTAWPFTRNFYLILNLAVGGDWGAVKGVDAAAFPQRLEVDYVRVYQRAGS